jgi:hypothetical protein
VAASALNEIGAKAMPPRTYRFRSLITRFVLLSLAAVALAVLRPAKQATARVQVPRRRRSRGRRIAVSLTFATLFFAGASFSAGAGDMMAQLVEDQASTAAAGADQQAASAEDEACEVAKRSDWDAEDVAGSCPEEQATDDQAAAEGQAATDQAAAPEAATEAPAAEAAPVSAPEAEATTAADLVQQTAANEMAVQQASSASAAAAPSLKNTVRAQTRKATPRSKAKGNDSAPPVLKPAAQTRTFASQPDPEVAEPNTAATIWLHRSLPDPTPPSKRLTKRFSRNLVFAAHKHHVDWALMLGVLRARGYRGSVPATKVGLNRLAKNLVANGARKNQWNAVLALEGRTAFADRSVALARYHRAVGLKALVRGLEAAKKLLVKRTLRDKRITIYPGGRADLIAGRIDVRTIVAIRYLAVAHKQITVSCLESGHRLFSRPGHISAHIYGLAVDISALGGESILGHQMPGSVTEQAVRDLLLLPAEVRPAQVISLLGLGGPSFPLANHDDHIHVGY